MPPTTTSPKSFPRHHQHPPTRSSHVTLFTIAMAATAFCLVFFMTGFGSSTLPSPPPLILPVTPPTTSSRSSLIFPPPPTPTPRSTPSRRLVFSETTTTKNIMDDDNNEEKPPKYLEGYRRLTGHEAASYIDKNLFSNFKKEYEQQNTSSAASLDAFAQSPASQPFIFKWQPTKCMDKTIWECSRLNQASRDNGGPFKQLESLRRANTCCLFASEGTWDEPFSPTFFDELSSGTSKIFKSKIIDRLDVPNNFENEQQNKDQENENQEYRDQKLLENLFSNLGESVRRPTIHSFDQSQMLLLLGLSRLPKIPTRVRYISPEEYKKQSANLRHEEYFDNSNDIPFDRNQYTNESSANDKIQNVVRIHLRGNSFLRNYFSAMSSIFRSSARYFDRGTHAWGRYVITNYGDYYSITVPKKGPFDRQFHDFIKVSRHPDEVVFLDVTYIFEHGTNLPAHPSAPQQGRYPTSAAAPTKLQGDNPLSKHFFPHPYPNDPIYRLGGEYSAVVGRPFRLYYVETYPSAQERHQLIQDFARYSVLRYFDCGLYRRKIDAQKTSPASCYTAFVDAAPGQEIPLSDVQEEITTKTMKELRDFYTFISPIAYTTAITSDFLNSSASSSASNYITPQWIIEEVKKAEEQQNSSSSFLHGFIPSQEQSPNHQIGRRFVWIHSPTKKKKSLWKRKKFLSKQKQEVSKELEATRTEDMTGHSSCILYNGFPAIAYTIRANERSKYSGVTSEDEQAIEGQVFSAAGAGSSSASSNFYRKQIRDKYISSHLVCRDITSKLFWLKFALGAFYQF